MRNQPVLFLAHGDPMNALRDDPFTQGLRALGAGLARPDAIVVASAHWLARGTLVGGAAEPATIHDFGGFPDELYRQQYPAPGAPDLAAEIASLLPGAAVDPERGLDHGVWTVLKFLFPQADVPVVPLAIDAFASPEALAEQGRILRGLRARNVLVAGSGNVVHNVPMYFARRDDAPFPWAEEFDARVRDALVAREPAALHALLRDPLARMAHPTPDHLLPLFLCAGAAAPDEHPTFPYESVARSMSMRCVRWG